MKRDEKREKGIEGKREKGEENDMIGKRMMEAEGNCE